jgi:hypothetical protein
MLLMLLNVLQHVNMYEFCNKMPTILRARFNISKPTIICSSHKKYEFKQVWSLLQYRELENTEMYTKAHQNMKNN